MYYTNIANEELQYFNNQKVHNFTIKLSELLETNLFKIEEIIPNTIYKIYPLFYTSEITSSNADDKIIDNKLIICNKTEKETYFTFISNQNEEIKEYNSESYHNYYDIGDTLTTNKFNAIVSLLRSNTTHNDNIILQNGILSGNYADYEINIGNTTQLDTGLLITEETLQSEPGITLLNPLFVYSKYTIILKILRFTGVNILDDTTPSDFKLIKTIELELTNDTETPIPISELQDGDIIQLESNIKITHDKPIIPGNWVTEFLLTTSKNSISIGETCTLQATLKDRYDQPYAGQEVVFKKGDVVLDTVYTDSEGVASYVYTGVGAGTVTFTAIADGKSVSVNVNDGSATHDYELVVSSDKDVLSYYDEDSASLSATLTDNGVGIDGEVVSFKVYKESDDSLVETLTGTTNSQGVATVSYVSKGTGDLNIHCEALQGSLVSEIYIEDCSYYNANEVSRTTTNGSTIYDNNLSMALPTNCEISHEIWSNNSNTSSEHRYFLLPLSQYRSRATQPQYALFFDQLGGNNGFFGKRENNSTVALSNNFNCTGSTYHTIKYVKNGTTVEIYVDDELKVTTTISWIDNYSDYSLSMMRWTATGTSKIRNVKFKPL